MRSVITWSAIILAVLLLVGGGIIGLRWLRQSVAPVAGALTDERAIAERGRELARSAWLKRYPDVDARFLRYRPVVRNVDDGYLVVFTHKVPRPSPGGKLIHRVELRIDAVGNIIGAVDCEFQELDPEPGGPDMDGLL